MHRHARVCALARVRACACDHMGNNGKKFVEGLGFNRSAFGVNDFPARGREGFGSNQALFGVSWFSPAIEGSSGVGGEPAPGEPSARGAPGEPSAKDGASVALRHAPARVIAKKKRGRSRAPLIAFLAFPPSKPLHKRLAYERFVQNFR